MFWYFELKKACGLSAQGRNTLIIFQFQLAAPKPSSFTALGAVLVALCDLGEVEHALERVHVVQSLLNLRGVAAITPERLHGAVQQLVHNPPAELL